MIRKLAVMFLGGVMCLATITSALAADYKEAPMLRLKVAAGELPPLSERLPKEPMVITPRVSIGKYGGELLLIQRDIDGGNIPLTVLAEPLLGRSREDPNKIVPNLARDWELSKDAKTFTLYLREGAKWSDGAPFTADDILFWYNDILLNKELTPTIPGMWKPGGEVMKVEKINDYTIKYKFSGPYPGILYVLSDWWTLGGVGHTYSSAHYLTEFHIKYNPDADKLAKEEGFDYWYQLFQNKRSGLHESIMTNPKAPLMSSWVVKEKTLDHISLVRNPYYWKVDTEGNQLPYIDRAKGILAEDPELRAAKIFAGEPDLAEGEVGVKKLPVVKENAKKNNYKVYLIPFYPQRTTEVALFFNHTVEDPFLRELFSNVKFKKALSLAIDRDDINEAVFLGTAESQQVVIGPFSPFYEEKFAKAYTQYDPEKAKKLLGEIGLERDEQGYILRPDGKTLNLIIEVAPWIISHEPAAELVAEYWDAIGVKTLVHFGNLMFELFEANKAHVSTWVIDETSYSEMKARPLWWASCYFWGWEWYLWFESDGKEGSEPPAKVKELFGIFQEIAYTVGEEKRIEMGRRGSELLSENLWMIGVIGNAKQVGVRRTSLKNVNEESYGVADEVFEWYFEE